MRIEGSSQKPLVIVGLTCPAGTPPKLKLPALGGTHRFPMLILRSSLALTSVGLDPSSSSSIGTSSAAEGIELPTLEDSDEKESARGRPVVVVAVVLVRRRVCAAARAMGEV